MKNGSRSTGTLHTYQSQANLHLIPAFGVLRPQEVTAKLIAAYRKKREQEINQQGNNRKVKAKSSKLIKDSTVNRELALLRKAMRGVIAVHCPNQFSQGVQNAGGQTRPKGGRFLGEIKG